jgi:hypothetical protein
MELGCGKMRVTVNKSLNVFYRVVMPALVVIFLWGVSQIIVRPKLLGSGIADVLVRLLLGLWLIRLYRAFPYRKITPVSNWPKTELDFVEKAYYIGLGLMSGPIMGFVTWWAIRIFLPIFKDYSVFIAGLNGLIFCLPTVLYYEKLKP